MEFTEELVDKLLQAMPTGQLITGDEADFVRRAELLAEIAAPELKTVMIARSLTGEFDGVDGYRGAWADWLEPFAAYRIDVEEVRQIEGGLMIRTHQVVTPKGTDVEMESEAAAVLFFGDGRLERVEFHLDPEAAEKAAGLHA
jgi:hypothetical protein